jgi:hypothetical protein
MRRARERYRVYSEEEFFAEERRLSTAEEHDLQAGLRVGGRRARGARRLAGLAVLIGAVAAASVVVAIDALRPVGGSRRRDASSRVARVGPPGTTSLARGKEQLPRALARQSRRNRRPGQVRPLRAQLAAGPRVATRSASSGGAGAPDGRTSVDRRGPGPNPDDVARDRPSPGASAASRPADIVDREEGHRTAVATGDVAALAPREEFGFER